MLVFLFRTIWEIVMMVVFLLHFILMPLYIIYDTLGEINTFFKYLCCTLDVLCLIDAGMNFITGYYDVDRKEVVLDPKKVARHYLITFFVVDIISSMPNEFSHNKLNQILMYAALLKYLRFFTFRKYCIHFAENFDWSFLYLSGFTSIISVCLYCHIICCVLMYLYIKLYWNDAESMYAIDEDGEKMTMSTGYLSALYSAILISCATGYDKVVNRMEIKLFLILFWCLSKTLYIYFLALSLSMVQSISSSRHKYFEVVQQLREYMRHKMLPVFLQRRITDYYEFRFQKCFFREHEIISTVSDALQQEITVHQCRRLVERVEFFKNMPTTILIRIASCLKTEVFLVNDVIIRANTLGDSMYFISTGNVAIYSKSGKEVCHLEDGDYFGEIAIVMESQRRVASVIALEICEVFRLDRKDFVRAIYPYPDLLNQVLAIASDRFERTSIIDEQFLIAKDFHNL